MNYVALEGTKNTSAEVIGVINLLKELKSKLNVQTNYIVYTDCTSLIKRLTEKETLLRNGLKNHNGKLINDYSLYQELFSLTNDNIVFSHIDGHISSKLMNDDNRQFSRLDKFLRSKLRSYRV